MKRILGSALVLFAANGAFAQAGETISIVNARTLAVEHQIPAERNPHELAVSPDGLAFR